MNTNDKILTMIIPLMMMGLGIVVVLVNITYDFADDASAYTGEYTKRFVVGIFFIVVGMAYVQVLSYVTRKET